MNHKTSKTPFGNVLPLLAAPVIGFAVAATLNGKPLGILWKPPYTYDVTGIIRSGKNELKIEIVNLWANRLVGDANLPREKRVTRITQKVPIAGPHESGLLGPVQLRLLGETR